MAIRKLSSVVGKWPSALSVYKNGVSTPIKRILTYRKGVSKEIYPESPVRIRVTSNFDDSLKMRAESGWPYPHPIINCVEETFTLTITPYPHNAGWYLEFENFDIAGEGPLKIHYGTETLIVPVTQPAEEGRSLRRIIVRPLNDVAEATTFSFWTDYYLTSAIQAIHRWSFDDRTLTDEIGGISFVNEHTIPLAFNSAYDINDNGYCYQTKYFDDAQAGQLRTIVPHDATNGYSLTCYVRGNLNGNLGFNQVDRDANQGMNMRFYFTYAQPRCYVGPWSVTGTSPATSTADRLTTSKWNHLAVTLSPPVVVEEGENWSHVDTTWTYTSSAVAYSKTFTDSIIAANVIQIAKFYINGVQQGEVAIPTTHTSIAAGTSWLTHMGGDGTFVAEFSHSISTTDSPTYIDGISLYDKELSINEVQNEAMVVGYTFEEGGGAVATPVAMDTFGRTRSGLPVDLDAIPLTSHLKAFVLDSSTIVVAGEFHDFFRERLLAEWPVSLPAEEFNYRYISESWTRDYKYMYCYWDLYGDYVPRIVNKYDSVDYWNVDGVHPEIIGRWQSAIGLVRIPDAYDGTDLVRPQGNTAELAHFVYMRLSEPMTLGSTHTILDGDGNTVTFTYDRNEYSRAIKVNQCGYLPEAGRKYAYFGQWLGTGGAYHASITDLTFYLVPVGSDTPAFTGLMTLRGAVEGGVTTDISYRSANETNYLLNGEETYELDFSSFSTEGEYQIYIPGVGYSYPFKVQQKAIIEQFWTHARGMFHQRSGIAKVPPQTNWTYPQKCHYITYGTKFISTNSDYGSCIDSDGVVYPNNQFSMIANNETGEAFRDMKGGWFDACDFDRRPQHWICVEDMVGAFLLFPENFSDNQLDIPESGDGVPDILSEAEWCLNLWRASQSDAGGIAMWCETTSHERDWPWRSKMKYHKSMVNRYDSMVYAFLAARFARACQIAGTSASLNKATIYAESAIRAFKFGIDPANKCVFEFDQVNSSGVSKHYTYTESTSLNEWYFKSAAALFVLTNDAYFQQYLTKENYDLHYDVMASDANDFPRKICPELLLNLKDLYPDFYEQEMASITSRGEAWIVRQEANTYRLMNWEPNHTYFTYQGWGVVHPETRGRIYPYLYKITGDTKWRDQTLLALDWACGCNGMGRSLTSGLGHVYPVRFLHHWLPRAEVELGIFEAPPGITPYCHVGPTFTGNTRVYYLSMSSFDFLDFKGVMVNIMPGSVREETGTTSDSVNIWLRTHRPMFRTYNEEEDTTVAMSEFTISETMSGKLFMAGCVMGANATQDPLWKLRVPATNRFAIDGYIYLP